MACSKDIPHSSRPIGQQRLSNSNNSSSSLPKTHGRIYTHSNSSSPLTSSSHRVTRRKSVSTYNSNNSNSNNAAMAAAVKEAAAATTGSTQSIPIVGRRIPTWRTTKTRLIQGESAPSLSSMSLPTQRIRLTHIEKSDPGDSAIIDDDIDDIDDVGDVDDDDDDVDDKMNVKSENDDERVSQNQSSQERRASDDHQHVLKDGKKSSLVELKCDKCGKGYKHSSCLSKHLWEHTPEWSYTSKLLISKHQQVQLLEAASVLLNMTQDVNTTTSLAAHDYSSDHDSASASSEQNDHFSSTETTPPPQVDLFNTLNSSRRRRRSFTRNYKRCSSASGWGQDLAYSNKLSTCGNKTLHVTDENTCDPYVLSKTSNTYKTKITRMTENYDYLKQFNIKGRPNSACSNDWNPEDESLASAVQLLSCSFGSSGTPIGSSNPIIEETSPIPNIPLYYYLDQTDFSNSTFSLAHPRQKESYTRARIEVRRDDDKMDIVEGITDDEEYDHRSQARSDEDDDGVFGRMEE